MKRVFIFWLFACSFAIGQNSIYNGVGAVRIIEQLIFFNIFAPIMINNLQLFI